MSTKTGAHIILMEVARSDGSFGPSEGHPNACPLLSIERHGDTNLHTVNP